MTASYNHEHRMELQRQRAIDQQNIEGMRLRDERALAQQRGSLREREQRLERMEWQLDKRALRSLHNVMNSPRSAPRTFWSI